jgi:hypothetical protein
MKCKRNDPIICSFQLQFSKEILKQLKECILLLRIFNKEMVSAFNEIFFNKDEASWGNDGSISNAGIKNS